MPDTEDFQELIDTEFPVVEPVVEPAAELVFAAEPAVVVFERRYVSDVELQEELTRIADGARIQQRVTVTGEVTDVFVNGGNFAPGRARWVQTNGYDPVEKQAVELAAALQ